MKRLYFIIASVALLALFTACSDEDGTVGSLKNLKVSETNIAFDLTGGSQTITLTAKTDWAFDGQYIPEWLTVSPLSGGAGEYSVTFTAEEVLDADSAELEILVGNIRTVTYYVSQNVVDDEGEDVLDDEGNNVTELVAVDVLVGDDNQFINVAIGEPVDTAVEILEILNNGVVGKTYIVSGWCVSIANTSYGNWYMADDDGNRLYIYGTMTSGKYDWDSEGIEVGDYVTVKGPLSIYNGTYELVDVVVMSVEKNLISVKAEADPVLRDGGETSVVLEVGGNGLTVGIPDEDRSWLSVSSIVDAVDSVTVVFYLQPNETEENRSSTVTFSTVSGDTTYSTEAVIYQYGPVVEATAAEINAGVDGVNYQVSGYITSVASTTYGNFYLSDYTGEVYVYGTLDADGNSMNWESLGIDEGDIVTVVGPKSTYTSSSTGESTVELVDVTVLEHFPVTDATVAEFNAAEVATDVYYRLTGEVTSIANATYGNLYLKDSTGEVYVYGLDAGYGGGDFADTGIEEGDTIIIVGTRGQYGDTIEAMYSFYVGTVSEDDDEDDGDGGN